MQETGIRYDVPFREYLEWPGLHKTRLWKAHTHSLAHYRYDIEHPKEGETDALVLGHGTHTAILEPDEFDTRYTLRPQVYTNDKGEEKKWTGNANVCKAWLLAHEGDDILEQEQWDKSLAMRDAVAAHPDASRFLAGAKMEVSIQWNDPDTGLLLKARLDADSHGHIIDVKSCRDANVSPFGAAAYKYGYHYQGAMYHDGMVQVSDKEVKAFIIIAVESSPPHAIVVYEVDREALLLGRDQYKATLFGVRRAMKTGIWPGYGEGVFPLVLPSYAGMELSTRITME